MEIHLILCILISQNVYLHQEAVPNVDVTNRSFDWKWCLT